jgi:hypothetical protein
MHALKQRRTHEGFTEKENNSYGLFERKYSQIRWDMDQLYVGFS